MTEVLPSEPPKLTRTKRQPKTREPTDAELDQWMLQYMERRKIAPTETAIKPVKKRGSKTVHGSTCMENETIKPEKKKRAGKLVHGSTCTEDPITPDTSNVGQKPNRRKKAEPTVPSTSGIKDAAVASLAKYGSKEDVFYGRATQTKGGLTKSDLMENAKGKVISKRAYQCGVNLIQKLKGDVKAN